MQHPRGKPFTTEQVGIACEVYRRTGNYQEAADAIGATESGARRAILRAGESSRVALHARACERGLRAGRRGLLLAIDSLVGMLRSAQTPGAGMEPRDVSGAAQALAKVSAALLAMSKREDDRKQSRLTREKTRVETEIGRARLDGTLPSGDVPVTTINLQDPVAVQRRIDELLRASGRVPGQDGTGTAGLAGGTEPPG